MNPEQTLNKPVLGSMSQVGPAPPHQLHKQMGAKTKPKMKPEQTLNKTVLGSMSQVGPAPPDKLHRQMGAKKEP